jgi:hypothetical protein
MAQTVSRLNYYFLKTKVQFQTKCKGVSVLTILYVNVCQNNLYCGPNIDRIIPPYNITEETNDIILR